MTKRWILPAPLAPQAAEALSDFSPLERRILYQRGVSTREEAERFLASGRPTLDDPFCLAGMTTAVARVLDAVRRKARIVIYGDYDADGVSGTALLVELLARIGADVSFYIPNRFTEGYGLHAEAIRQLKQQGSDLVVTVDCGIRAVSAVSLARELGLDVVVTDHHLPGETLPAAYSVIDPKREGDVYPFKDLTGVGVAFKLAQGISQESGGGSVEGGLDLVALGTVADVGSLRDENRWLVAKGLQQVTELRRPGIRALAEVAGLKPGVIDSRAVGFALAPRLNAAGRVGSADAACRLLYEWEFEVALEYAYQLDQCNQERQRLQQNALERALAQSEGTEGERSLLIVTDPDFHEGVLGLVASRLMDVAYRPVIVGRRGEEFTRCSARSIPGFSIIQALDEVSDVLIRYGGHDTAAGMLLRTADLGTLERRLGELASAALRGEDLRPALLIDAEVTLSELDSQVLGFVERLEPCGEGNPRPLFLVRGVRVLDARRVGAEKRHLKLTVEGDRCAWEGIAFGQGGRMTQLAPQMDLVFHLERNKFMGFENMELNVVDMEKTGLLTR